MEGRRALSETTVHTYTRVPGPGSSFLLWNTIAVYMILRDTTPVPVPDDEGQNAAISLATDVRKEEEEEEKGEKMRSPILTHTMQ